MTDITPGEIAAGYGGTIGQADVPGFVGRLEGARKLNELVKASPVFGPGEMDPLDREYAYRHQFFLTVGRMPSDLELAGLPVYSCDSCRRLSGTEPCDEHRRELGAPIEYPPKPWPSDDPMHVPGTSVILRPGQKPPKFASWDHLRRSVG